MLRGSRAFSGKIHRPFLAEVGTTKDQGLYNKPSAAVHLGALAAGTLPQYNTIIHLQNVSNSRILTVPATSKPY